MKNKTKLKQLTVATIAGLQFALPAFAADTNEPVADNSANSNSSQAAEIDALKQEVQELAQKINALESQQQAAAQPSATEQDLDQKVRVLERERENDKEDAAALAKTQPKISMGQNGFSFSSADTNFVATLHGILQLDSRTFFGNSKLPEGTDGFLLRRARPIFTGTVFQNFDFNFTPDFGGSTVQIQDAYINYHYNPLFQLEAGKFKSPVGLEQLQTDSYIYFNERSIANDLIPNRDLGWELHGDVLGGVVSYAAGLFDGAPDYNGTTFNSSFENGKAFAGRLFLQPFKTTTITPLQGLGVGVGGSYENDHDGVNGLTPGYTTDGQQKFFTYAANASADGTHWRISPQGYYYYGPFSFLGEYAVSDQKIQNTTTVKTYAVQNTAWEISGGWVLTGEDASYNGVTPLHPFSLIGGGWGAWQIVARYENLDVDDNVFAQGLASAATSASGAHAFSVGLNWYLNRNIRVDASVSHTDFEGGTGTGATVTKQPENVLFTRVQLAF
ncbi:MAG: porin [Verrucomicrobiota bacterium]|jgi:phosphate-selective porin OprO/OprP